MVDGPPTVGRRPVGRHRLPAAGNYDEMVNAATTPLWSDLVPLTML